MCSIKAKELESILSLQEDHLEVLLEYIYKGWERLSNKDASKKILLVETMQVMVNTSILVLHKAIVQKLGIGSILKVANYQDNRVWGLKEIRFSLRSQSYENTPWSLLCRLLLAFFFLRRRLQHFSVLALNCVHFLLVLVQLLI